MSGLRPLGSSAAGVETAIAGNAGEAGKALKADDAFLLGRALAGSFGEGAPAKGLEKGAFYTQISGGAAVAFWEGQGTGKVAVQRIDLTGTPADGSVTLAKFAAALVDGAAGVPSLRTLVTQILGTDNAHAPTAKAAFLQSPIRPGSPPSGSFISPPFTSKSTAALGTKEVLILFPINFLSALTTSAIAVNVAEAGEGAGQQVRLGVYADDGTGSKPTGKPLWDAGAVSTTVVGQRPIEADKSWEPGRYWLGVNLQGTLTKAPVFTTASVPSQPLGFTSFTETSNGLKQLGAGSSALPEIGTLASNNLAQVLPGLKAK